MDSGRRSFIDRILVGPWLLAGSAALLAACWWMMNTHLFPALQLPFPDQWRSDPWMMAGMINWTLGDKLSFWIASKGWDAGPPGEYVYDFIWMWHLALSAFLYSAIFSRIQALARGGTKRVSAAEAIPANTIRILFGYPVVCAGVYMAAPWTGNDGAVMGKAIGLIVYPLFFWPATLIALCSIGEAIPSASIRICCVLLGSICLISPFAGGGVDIIFILGIPIAVLVWALTNSMQYAARIHSRSPMRLEIGE